MRSGSADRRGCGLRLLASFTKRTADLNIGGPRHQLQRLEKRLLAGKREARSLKGGGRKYPQITQIAQKNELKNRRTALPLPLARLWLLAASGRQSEKSLP
jgi:hypothetical protein